MVNAYVYIYMYIYYIVLIMLTNLPPSLRMRVVAVGSTLNIVVFLKIECLGRRSMLAHFYFVASICSRVVTCDRSVNLIFNTETNSC